MVMTAMVSNLNHEHLYVHNPMFEGKGRVTIKVRIQSL